MLWAFLPPLVALSFPTEASEIPTEPVEAVKANIREMIAYAELGLEQDLGDGDLKRFAFEALTYARNQLQRLARSLDEDVDLIAWIGRCLYELLLLTRWALKSPDNLLSVMVRRVGDMSELDRAWFDGDPGDRSDPDVADFKDSVQAMEAFVEEEGLTVPRRLNYREMAEETESEEYFGIYKTLSKYSHPTSVFLFARDSFIRGDKSRRAMYLAAQLSAAWFLEEMPGLVKQMKAVRAQTPPAT